MATLETQPIRDVFWGDAIREDVASYAVSAAETHTVRGWVDSK